MQAGQVDIRGLAEIESRASAVHRRWLKTLRRYHQEVTQLLEAVGMRPIKTVLESPLMLRAPTHHSFHFFRNTYNARRCSKNVGYQTYPLANSTTMNTKRSIQIRR